MSRHPEVKWAQREDKVYLTVQLPDAKNANVNLDPEGTFTFTASCGAGDNAYELKMDLFDKVNVEESKINYGPRNIFCIVEKAEKTWWKKLLRGDDKPPHYVKVDWDKWVDEDEDTGPADLDMGGMDFSKFANMGGMGMPGMGDMGGMGMPGMGGMGMPGMGGMGMPGMGDMGMGMPGMGDMGMGMPGMGMPGMGGPDEFEDSDDEDDEVTKPEGQETGDAGASKAEGATSAKPEA